MSSVPQNPSGQCRERCRRTAGARGRRLRTGVDAFAPAEGAPGVARRPFRWSTLILPIVSLFAIPAFNRAQSGFRASGPV